MPHSGDTVSFVIRIWLERGQDGGAVWRGHIRHVQTDKERHFRRLEEMCGFMEGLAGAECGAFGEGAGGDGGRGA
ncbi:MAG: hypothetical protein IT545_09200 [Rhodobacteraceae bacterium]|nr:hypothetical protein [Paracoccaceae bacterium]